jgi:hypothetical protein
MNDPSQIRRIIIIYLYLYLIAHSDATLVRSRQVLRKAPPRTPTTRGGYKEVGTA